ncbi:eggshell protein 2A-like [Punica granatum]|uniref:Eggshell protein 2A-like n=1 Tax=Punica granatum TaxID=22663 RepID=A0A6P8D799_PUNGR|nr:eggshell protein 2A-like [Punica granatum]
MGGKGSGGSGGGKGNGGCGTGKGGSGHGGSGKGGSGNGGLSYISRDAFESNPQGYFLGLYESVKGGAKTTSAWLSSALCGGLNDVNEGDRDLGEGDACGDVANCVEEVGAEKGEEDGLGDLGQGCSFRVASAEAPIRALRWWRQEWERPSGWVPTLWDLRGGGSGDLYGGGD